MAGMFAPLLLLAVSLQIEHEPIECMLKDRFQAVYASVRPTPDVQAVRLHFRAEKSPDFHFVEMTFWRGRFRARLPRPRADVGSVVYYIEAEAADSSKRRTPTHSAQVVAAPGDCSEDARFAEPTDSDDLLVFSESGTRKPDGFKGVARVARAGDLRPEEAEPGAADAPDRAKPGAGEKDPKPARLAENGRNDRATARPPAKAGKAEEDRGGSQSTETAGKAKEEKAASRAPEKAGRGKEEPAESRPSGRPAKGKTRTAAQAAGATGETGRERDRPRPAAEEPERPSSFRSVADSTSEDYLIGADDVLKVTVYGHEDLTQTVVVQVDGTFTFPLVSRVQAAGLTPRELERKIATLLAEGFVRDPKVTVVIQEYKSQTVYVVGEVMRPGTYPLSGSRSIVEILAKAGPTTANAGYTVVVVRPAEGQEGPVLPTDLEEEPDQRRKAEVLTINLRDIQTGDLRKNIVLRKNDTIFVPQAPRVYLSGEVRLPGAYPFPPGTTVRQAISLAGGLTENGSGSRIRVVRAQDGRPKEMKIKLDEPVEAGDTILVKSKLF